MAFVGIARFRGSRNGTFAHSNQSEQLAEAIDHFKSVVIIDQYLVCSSCDPTHLGSVAEIPSACLCKVAEVPFYRYVSLARNEQVRYGAHVAHIRLDQKASADDSLKIAPANLPVAKRT